MLNRVNGALIRCNYLIDTHVLRDYCRVKRNWDINLFESSVLMQLDLLKDNQDVDENVCSGHLGRADVVRAKALQEVSFEEYARRTRSLLNG